MKLQRKGKTRRNFHAEYIARNFAFNELSGVKFSLPPLDRLKREYKKTACTNQQTA